MVLGRFVTVSLLCAVLHNAIMIAGDALGLHYVASSLLSFAIVVATGYLLHSAWSFPAAQRATLTFARYAVSMSINLPLFVAGMFVVVNLAGFPVPIAAPLVTVLLLVFNFFATRWALRA